MNDENNSSVTEPVKTENNDVDENMSLFIYGNIKIKDVDTGEILVNQRF